MLALPGFAEVFVVELDAYGFGLEAMLMQRHKPISYFSYGLIVREQLKHVYERKLMAIVLPFQKWRHYLVGRRL